MITTAQRYAIPTVLFLVLTFHTSKSLAADAEGSGSAIFLNPTPSSAVVSGVGTSGFSWGTPLSGSSSSNLNFSGQAFTADFDSSFSVGTLRYFNGTINSGTQADSVDMVVTIQVSMPGGGDQSFTQTLTLINTPNTSDPIASGDIVRLPTSIPEIKFDVGGIEHTLRIEGFGTISGAGGASSIDRFFALEEGSASAELIASISPVCPVSEGFRATLEPVPGPEGGMLRYKANITRGLGGDAVGVAATLCNPNSKPVKLVMCSMANQDAPEVPHDLRNAVFSGGVWSCPPGPPINSFPSYHFGCQRLEIAPGEKKAVFNDGGVLGANKRLAPYIDFLRDGAVASNCTTNAPSGVVSVPISS